jgi:DNA primase
MKQELEKLYNILAVFLGEAKNGFDENTYQYQFPCPNCVERDGWMEARKYNLEVNLQKQVFKCWKCCSIDEHMSGSIIKLIRMHGNDKLLQEYKDVIHEIRNSELYKINFTSGDFNIDTSVIEREELKLPSSYKPFKKDGKNNWGALKYLQDRGIGWDIIERYKIGYTEREEENKKGSFRIIIPSYNALGELNYWVGRDYLPKSDKFPSRVKYDNPKVEKKNIIFNEEKLQWNADITLVEGPFDHIVVPNSVPLLGKALNKEYKLYWDLISDKFNGSAVNIFLDGDAFNTVKEIYKFLNHGRLYGKVRYIPVEVDEDPSSLYQSGGYKKIVEHLRNAQQIDEVYLQ